MTEDDVIPDAVGVLDVLDHVAWSSLTGPHAVFAAEAAGQLNGLNGLNGAADGGAAPAAIRYPADVSPFAALRPGSGLAGWEALARLTPPDDAAVLTGAPSLIEDLPPGWTLEAVWPGVQLVATPELDAVPDPDAVRLTADDTDDMLELVEQTQPGPFLRRTGELGTYLGIRRDGRLIAMAGERLHPLGHTEISAVCTSPDHRGQGLAGRLIRAVAHGIRARDETPFLHTLATNTGAIRLYEHLGFVLRREVGFFDVLPPR